MPQPLISPLLPWREGAEKVWGRREREGLKRRGDGEREGGFKCPGKGRVWE